MTRHIRLTRFPFCRPRRADGRASRGLSLMVVMIALLVISLMCGIAVRNIVLQNRLTRSIEFKTHAAWLAESALQRAGARMALDSTYTGETWERPISLSGSVVPARATIRVLADTTDIHKVVHVEAMLFAGQPAQTVVNHSAIMTTVKTK